MIHDATEEARTLHEKCEHKTQMREGLLEAVKDRDLDDHKTPEDAILWYWAYSKAEHAMERWTVEDYAWTTIHGSKTPTFDSVVEDWADKAEDESEDYREDYLQNLYGSLRTFYPKKKLVTVVVQDTVIVETIIEVSAGLIAEIKAGNDKSRTALLALAGDVRIDNINPETDTDWVETQFLVDDDNIMTI